MTPAAPSTACTAERAAAPRGRPTTPRAPALGTLAVGAALALAGAGCRPERRVPERRDTAAMREYVRATTPQGAYGSGTTYLAAAEFAAFPDSAAAARLRDSLARAGWRAYLRRGADRSWRVRAARGNGYGGVAQAIVAELRATRPDLRPAAVPDTVPDSLLAPLALGPLRVDRALSGMSARARWVASPDDTQLLAVVDWVGAEGDPAPDAAVWLRAGDFPLHVDSVWDAAPSPRWDGVIVGRAHVLRATGGDTGDSVPAARWDSLARYTGIPSRDLRAGAFPMSGMSSVMTGVSQVELRHTRAPKLVVARIAAGWRVGYSADGSAAVAGARPGARVRDDAAATRWLAIDPRDGTPRGELPAGARPAPVPWRNAPALDDATFVDTAHVAIAVDGGTVESAGGWVRRNGVVLGPGAVLAATRTGKQILVLARDPAAAPGRPPLMLAYYWSD